MVALKPGRLAKLPCCSELGKKFVAEMPHSASTMPGFEDIHRGVVRLMVERGGGVTMTKSLGVSIALAMLVLGSTGLAADASGRRPVKAADQPASYDWTGMYVGGHVGYSRGNAQVTLADPASTDFASSFGSLTGGVQLGYNYLLPSRILLGVEADMSFLNSLAADDVAWSRLTPVADTAEKIDYMATLRGRLGYAFPRWMMYVTGGWAWSLGRYLQNPGVTDDIDKLLHLHTGWALGAGAEVAIARSWTARIEYLYHNFGHAEVLFPSGTAAASAFDVHTVRAGLNYKLGAAAPSAGSRRSAAASTNPVRQLGDPRPDDLRPAGLPRISVALSRREQLHAVGAGASDLVERRFHWSADMGGRRALLQSRAAAGLRPARYDGRGGLSQRRGAEVEFRLSALQHIAPVLAADGRAWRRTGDRRERLRPDGRQEGCLAANLSGRQVLRARCFRQQPLRHGHCARTL